MSTKNVGILFLYNPSIYTFLPFLVVGVGWGSLVPGLHDLSVCSSKVVVDRVLCLKMFKI